VGRLSVGAGLRYYWPGVHTWDRGLTLSAGTVVFRAREKATGSEVSSTSKPLQNLYLGRYNLRCSYAQTYGITAVAWFESVLSTLFESTEVTT
jgi:hypothetical protein